MSLPVGEAKKNYFPGASLKGHVLTTTGKRTSPQSPLGGSKISYTRPASQVCTKNFTLFQCTEMSWCHTNSPKYQHLTTKNDTY